MASLSIIKPGFQSTTQDLGRFGYSHLGISISGAADPVSLRIGNLLLGNDENVAAIEMTLVGGEFGFGEDALITITGSNFQPLLNNKPIALWQIIAVKKNDMIKFSATLDGARCYLCIKGGFDIPKVLGSSSTHLLTKLGGVNGRYLIKGDKLNYNPAVLEDSVRQCYPIQLADELMSRRLIHVTRSSQTDFFSEETLELFSASIYKVTEEASRMGLRLEGHSLQRIKKEEVITEGVALGAVQVSHNGKPIILFVEHQTTGGYPKIANVVSADMHRVGQLRPRDEIKFEFTTIEQAYKRKLHLESLISVKHFERI